MVCHWAFPANKPIRAAVRLSLGKPRASVRPIKRCSRRQTWYNDHIARGVLAVGRAEKKPLEPDPAYTGGGNAIRPFDIASTSP